MKYVNTLCVALLLVATALYLTRGGEVELWRLAVGTMAVLLLVMLRG